MVVISKKYDFRELLTGCGYFGYLNSKVYHGTVEVGTPTSWLFGDAPDGRLMGTLTFGQLFGVRLGFRLWGHKRIALGIVLKRTARG